MDRDDYSEYELRELVEKFLNSVCVSLHLMFGGTNWFVFDYMYVSRA